MSQFTDDDRETLTECRTLLRGQQGRIKDHEKRIRKVETREGLMCGWRAGIGLCVSSEYQELRIKRGSSLDSAHHEDNSALSGCCSMEKCRLVTHWNLKSLSPP